MCKRKIITLLMWTFVFTLVGNTLAAQTANSEAIKRSKVIALVKKAQSEINKNGVQESIAEFKKNAIPVFMGDYQGMLYVSPLHPELLGKNQLNYKDAFGLLAVQEEINKAKSGGGWLKGRWRLHPQTGKYMCRKLYVLPAADKYYVGSWYYYASEKSGVCLL